MSVKGGLMVTEIEKREKVGVCLLREQRLK